MWATRRLEMQKLSAGWGKIQGFGGGVEVGFDFTFIPPPPVVAPVPMLK